MTKREKLIVSAYTGVLMTDFDDFHAYVEALFEHPVFTHEMLTDKFFAELMSKVKPEFMKLCEEEDTNA